MQPRDPAYPELKKTHTMARRGRPFTDYKPPAAAPVWAVIEGLGRYHVLLAALELGVFETLASAGPSRAEGLAERLQASSAHLESLLDSVTALGLLKRVGGAYDLNDTARRYLLDDGAASMTGLVPVAPGPHGNWARLAHTVRTGRPAEPIDDDPAAFYRPLVEGTFTTMWRCAVRADLQIGYSRLDAPLIVDVGAGAAPWSMAVLQAREDAKAVINDLDGVIGAARRKADELGVADRCEFRPGNFHDIVLEDDRYDLAVLGHICRTEGPSGARQLVEKAYAALRPEGRVVLADYFVGPDPSASPHSVLMGMTMMASTVNGFAVTNEAACDWLRGAGFEALRLIEHLRACGLAVCRPQPAPADERICRLRGLVNLNLALQLAPTGRPRALQDEVVGNDADFGATGRIFILTGPNRGGKTTWTQALGLAQILLQAGLFLPAQRADISPVDGLFTHFAAGERPLQASGRLGGEAHRLAAIFRHATRHSLLLFHESLASTSAGTVRKMSVMRISRSST